MNVFQFVFLITVVFFILKHWLVTVNKNTITTETQFILKRTYSIVSCLPVQDLIITITLSLRTNRVTWENCESNTALTLAGACWQAQQTDRGWGGKLGSARSWACCDWSGVWQMVPLQLKLVWVALMTLILRSLRLRADWRSRERTLGIQRVQVAIPKFSSYLTPIVAISRFNQSI